MRLGWSQGDREFFNTQEMIEAFSLAGIGRSPSRFDYAKLENMNGHYMRSTSDAELMAEILRTLPYLEAHKHLVPLMTEAKQAQLLAALPGLKERAKTLNELMDGAGFLFATRPLALDTKAKDCLETGGAAHLAGLLPLLSAIGHWTASEIEASVRAYAEAAGIKLGQAAQPLRAALTGRLTSPGIFDVLEVLGREESLRRLQDAAR